MAIFINVFLLSTTRVYLCNVVLQKYLHEMPYLRMSVIESHVIQKFNFRIKLSTKEAIVFISIITGKTMNTAYSIRFC